MSLNEVLPQSHTLFEGDHDMEVERINGCIIKRDVEDTINNIILDIEAAAADEAYWTRNRHTPYEEPNNVDDWGTPVCIRCNYDVFHVEARGGCEYEYPPDYFNEVSNCCRSCDFDGIKCVECGLSEKLIKTTRDRNARFHMEEGTFPEIYRCETCQKFYNPDAETIIRATDYDSEEDIIIEDHDGPFEPSTCPYCDEEHSPWECPTGLWDTYHNEFVIDTDGDSSLIEDEVEPGEIEEGEGDEAVLILSQGDTEVIKAALKVAMDIVFEVGEDIQEGKYLETSDKIKEAYDLLN